jgi:hypothetical protein
MTPGKWFSPIEFFTLKPIIIHLRSKETWKKHNMLLLLSPQRVDVQDDYFFVRPTTSRQLLLESLLYIGDPYSTMIRGRQHF